MPETDGEELEVARVATQPLTAQPLGDFGAIVREMLEAGVRPESIARLARITSYEAAFGTLYALDGRSCPGGHEMLLGSDPSGREMRPPD